MTVSYYIYPTLKNLVNSSAYPRSCVDGAIWYEIFIEWNEVASAVISVADYSLPYKSRVLQQGGLWRNPLRLYITAVRKAAVE